ncbi:MAG TPA: hypothetical protein VN039_05270 [Nitrospira sp.]|nr:hypothetical protein [Nitrospira sp.]
MEFPLQFSELTIPTGAGPEQQRITINHGNDGEIKVYNSSGNLVDALGGPNGQFIVYDNNGNMVISLASASGTDQKTGNTYDAGITTYSSGNTLNLFDAVGTWTASDGSQVIVEAGTGATIQLQPENAALGVGPWFNAQIFTSIAGGGHPAVEIDSPSQQGTGIASSIQLQGSSTNSGLTQIFYAADQHHFNSGTVDMTGSVVEMGNVAIGGTVITPTAANTPTKGTVNFSALSGTTAHGFAVAQNSNANTFVSITNIGTTSADIWISRPNTTATGVYYAVWYT